MRFGFQQTAECQMLRMFGVFQRKKQTKGAVCVCPRTQGELRQRQKLLVAREYDIAQRLQSFSPFLRWRKAGSKQIQF